MAEFDQPALPLAQGKHQKVAGPHAPSGLSDAYNEYKMASGCIPTLYTAQGRPTVQPTGRPAARHRQTNLPPSPLSWIPPPVAPPQVSADPASRLLTAAAPSGQSPAAAAPPATALAPRRRCRSSAAPARPSRPPAGHREAGRNAARQLGQQARLGSGPGQTDSSSALYRAIGVDG